MKEKTIAQSVYNVCKALGLHVRSYSGRAMYGKECLGFTTSSPLSDIADLSAKIVAWGELEESDRGILFEDVQQDSMGRDFILYFPMLSWADVETKKEGE